jgi:hypothetical protein
LRLARRHDATIVEHAPHIQADALLGVIVDDFEERLGGRLADHPIGKAADSSKPPPARRGSLR